MRPFQMWLFTIGVFVGAMILAFVVGRMARHGGQPASAKLDPELAVAIETSRRTLPEFVAKLQKPPAGAVAFAIKASFTEGGRAEMMWVDHLTYTAGAFDGLLADTPTVLAKLHKGDRVHVLEANVVDWEVIYHTPQGDVHEGAETDRVLRKHKAAHTMRRLPRATSAKPRFA
ncbi:MAG: DUF2314 domain-containing protein [Fimbriimonadaceae bacterium]